MPNWKKVIVSGSDAVLTSVTAPAGLVVTGSTIITGSLGVTGSFNQASASLATGLFAHAQGFAVTASGAYSHAEGQLTTASGSYSHAEGSSTIASGSYSHAEGVGTIASGQAFFALGANEQGSIVFKNAMRLEGENNLFFKFLNASLIYVKFSSLIFIDSPVVLYIYGELYTRLPVGWPLVYIILHSRRSGRSRSFSQVYLKNLA